MHTCHEFSLRHKTAENSPFRVVLNKTKLSKIQVSVRGEKKKIVQVFHPWLCRIRKLKNIIGLNYVLS